jgi:hypothetical protein
MKAPARQVTQVALAALTAALACSDGGGSADDPYLATYYHPADVAYSTYYWTDPWVYGDLYYSGPAPTAPPAWTAGNAIRALARGDTSVCPGQVSVTPKMTLAACSTTDDQMVRSGVTVVFMGCQLTGGGTIDGTFDVTGRQTVSDPGCGQGSIVTLTHTTVTTNLSFRSAAGIRLVIPSATDTGSNTFMLGETPAVVSIDSVGRFQYYDSRGKLLQDQDFNGTRTFQFEGSQQEYTVDGLVNLEDNTSTMTSTIAASGLARTNDCCHPTGGDLRIARVNGSSTQQHGYTFGPSCGQATQDSTNTTLQACP